MKTSAEKLFLKTGKTLRLISPPEDVVALLGEHGATLLPKCSSRRADVVVLFAQSRAKLESELDRAKVGLSAGGALWVAYPKGTSKIKADINRDSIREYSSLHGLEAVAIISICELWSCLRLKVEG